MVYVEVFIDMVGHRRPVGLLRQHPRRGGAITFEYPAAWLKASDSFSIDPALPLANSICSVALLQEAAGYFGLDSRAAREIIREVATVTAI